MSKKLEKVSRNFVLVFPKTIEGILGYYFKFVSSTSKKPIQKNPSNTYNREWVATGLSSNKR